MLPSKTFDLVTVAQAIHWFNFELFYKEVERSMKAGGKLAVFGYGLFKSDEKLNQVINSFYHEIIGPYWDIERKYVDEYYQTILFPFKEINFPDLENIFEWNFEQLIGFLESWSAVQNYIKANNNNPIELVYKDLKIAWADDEKKKIRFLILLRIGQV